MDPSLHPQYCTKWVSRKQNKVSCLSYRAADCSEQEPDSASFTVSLFLPFPSHYFFGKMSAHNIILVGESMTVHEYFDTFEIRGQGAFYGVENTDLDFVVDGWAAAVALSGALSLAVDAGDEEIVRDCLLNKKLPSNELVRSESAFRASTSRLTEILAPGGRVTLDAQAPSSRYSPASIRDSR